ncbi:tRNA glutamyl-Q(34) synthetase GluQRS [Alteromonas sp. CYL-A6]|uniref:tRNA glutamyl-Q(34) synthetase GluQRS n=1 Tax=Alteromonas nitratireducens TaxID=3390813 RepID=UPI0034B84817
MSLQHSAPYTGRFAPSPSGELHFGSLLAALASYLEARSHQGRWLVRMEDIDTPRCIDGTDTLILNALEVHGLHWDGEVLYQSRSHARYQQVIDSWLADGDAYFCTCTRKQIREAGGHYQGTCRHLNRPADDAAVRVILTDDDGSSHCHSLDFDDAILGHQSALAGSIEDAIVKRRDGLFAYNLVVVLDDIFQGVTNIVRGADLLPTTFTHRALYGLLNQPAPHYAHIPVAAAEAGFKLSKQNKAAPLNLSTPQQNLLRALRFLGQHTDPAWQDLSPSSLLDEAVRHWNMKKVPKTPEIIVDSAESTYHSGL